jgi:hypothetical protein
VRRGEPGTWRSVVADTPANARAGGGFSGPIICEAYPSLCLRHRVGPESREIDKFPVHLGPSLAGEDWVDSQ